MLLSMTGFGEARFQDENWIVRAEIRSVNNRHLKVTYRLSEVVAAMEPELEKIIRERVRRGTVQVTIRVDSPPRASDYRINRIALESYRGQLAQFREGQSEPPELLAAILRLPGVVDAISSETEAAEPVELWSTVSSVVREALDHFDEARRREGELMQAELLALGHIVGNHVDRVESRSPEVVEGYRNRLQERVKGLVSEFGVSVQPSDLIREVAIFAERGNIAEEITRLRSHLEQFESVVTSDTGDRAGRKLEFIVQEMGREANTMGSKSNDVTISREVFEIKDALEKIRELIQNVE